jgi:tetratricopeptide (TPR) repeat protein
MTQFTSKTPGDPASSSPDAEDSIQHFLLGSEFAASGEFEKAEQAFANAVLLAPAFHLARYQLGLLQFSTRRVAVAFLTWEPLLAMDEAEALPHFVRGFAMLAQDQFEAARAHFETGLNRHETNPAVFDDIRKVIDRIGAARQVDSPAASEEHSANQILISNYGKSGALH